MKYRRPIILAFTALLVLSLVLGGCDIHSDTLDAQMQKAITALNQKDTDTLRQLLPDEGLDEDGFLSDAAQLYEIWQPCDPSSARLIQLNISRTADQTITRGIYSVPENEQYNCIQLVFTESKGGASCLNSFHLG